MMEMKNRALRVLPRAVLAFVCVLVCGGIAAARDVALVTGKDSQVRVVKAADLAKMIKTTHKWPAGDDLTMVLTDPSSPEMRVVAEKLLSLTSDELKKLIGAANKTRLIFWVVSGDDEVLKVLQSSSSAVGLVNVYSINSNVDVLKIDGKLPLEPGYILHSQ
ncbi:MAG: hypothetical protein ABSD64_09875 [Terriglobales bacterium]|jgi:hypothetical protein